MSPQKIRMPPMDHQETMSPNPNGSGHLSIRFGDLNFTVVRDITYVRISNITSDGFELLLSRPDQMHRISTQGVEKTSNQERIRERQMDAQIAAQGKTIGDVSLKLAAFQDELSDLKTQVCGLARKVAGEPSGSIAGPSEGYFTSIESSPQSLEGQEWRDGEESPS